MALANALATMRFQPHLSYRANQSPKVRASQQTWMAVAGSESENYARGNSHASRFGKRAGVERSGGGVGRRGVQQKRPGRLVPGLSSRRELDSRYDQLLNESEGSPHRLTVDGITSFYVRGPVGMQLEVPPG